MHTKSAVRLALFPAALLLSLASIPSDRAPHAFRPSDAYAAVDPKADKNYDLASLETLRKSIVQIKDNYVDPSRISPKEMFTSGLEAVERQVAEVMVEFGSQGCGDQGAHKEPGVAAPVPAPDCGHANPTLPEGKVRVTVGNATRDFDYRDIDNIWQIPLKMRDVFTFIKDNLVTQNNDPREIEYAAINGMLSTLDPHSWLLKPDLYKEMKVQTRGEFGGLGFVISMIDDRLTVRKVLRNTPAYRAGIRKGDVITQIDNDSTVSMELQEAVDRMRGKQGTKVTIYVARKGQENKKLDLTRALITYETVTSKMLDQGVGYVRLSGFSGTTHREMLSAIRAMKAQNGGSLKGLVLDLRGNPGGLLEQAIQVSDAFLEEGTIVTTVGVNGTLREPKLARNDGGERDFPIAVLISSDSASASEIVAGALKNLNRAIIVGRTSFGKGSVQVLYDFKDKDSGEESALKLTIAQYLTPGDLSIQEVGITPDIEIVPARILKERIDLFAPPKTFRESDYDKHFFNAFARDEEQAKAARERAVQKPFETLRFLKEETAKERKAREAIESGQAPEEDDSDDPSDEDGVTLDYQIEFCRDLLAQSATSTNRQEQLRQAKPFVEQRRAMEQEKVRKTLEGMGINWGKAPQVADHGAADKVKMTAELRAPRTQAGDTMELALTAHNTGNVPIYRLRAYTKSDNNILDRREFVFGQINPKEKRTWTVPVKIPRYVPSRRDDVTVKWEDDQGDSLDDLHAESDIAELPRPAFAWSWQLINKESGDGTLHKGEQVEMVLDVKNIGVGKAFDAFAGLKNLAEDKVNVKKGRTKLGPILPGETKTATFILEAKKGFEDTTVPLRLDIGDKDTYEVSHEKILLPIGAAAQVTPSVAAVRVISEASVLANANEKANRIATAKKGAVLAAKGKLGTFYRVEWGKGRTGFIAATLVKEAPGAHGSFAKVAAVQPKEPPSIRVANLDTSHGGIEVDTDRFTLNGQATDPNGMRDLQIFVQHDNDYRKVFFKTARKPGDNSAGSSALDFTADLPLKPGNSTIFLIAREDDDLQAQRTIVIHRKQPAMAQAGKTSRADAPR
ncbi:MAG: MXAN_5808 family serine peptidase [Myxococcales bacterium]